MHKIYDVGKWYIGSRCVHMGLGTLVPSRYIGSVRVRIIVGVPRGGGDNCDNGHDVRLLPTVWCGPACIFGIHT